MKNGLLLFAHGARDPNWARPFEEVARRIRDRAPTVVAMTGTAPRNATVATAIHAADHGDVAPAVAT